MEKRRRHHSLDQFKSAMAAGDVEFTASAEAGARNCGIGVGGIPTVVATMVPAHFFKSMTSYADSRMWQDVYHVPAGDLVLYVKFTGEIVQEFKLLSFKER